jgi:hypothetical protein
MTNDAMPCQNLLRPAMLLLAVAFSFPANVLQAEEEMPAVIPDELAIKLVVPELKPTRAMVNTGYYEPKLELTNKSDKAIVLWPFLHLDVLDDAGKPVPHSMYIGRWGIREAPSQLEGIEYVTLEPGKTHTIPISFKSFGYDAHAIAGWRLVPDKNYRVVLRYEFDRASVVKEFGEGCAEPDAPEQPWNKIIPVKWKHELKLEL